LKQADASQTFGLKWAGGHGLASYNYHAASALKTSDRSYATAAGPGNLTPTDTRHHVFLTGSQDFGERFKLNADFGQSWRKVKNGYSNLSSANRLNHAFIRYGSESDQVFGSLGLDYRLSDRLTADLSVAYSEIDTDGFSSNVRFNRVPPPATMINYGSRNSQLDVMAKIGGSLWTLPGGDVRFSAGAGQLEEEFKGISPITIVQSAGTLGRTSTYAFAEVWAPVVGPGQDIPLVHSLEFSLAARYTDYKDESDFGPKRDFGDSVDPKAGFAWEPVEALRVRGTYGRSFRAPSLTQLDRTGGSHFLFEDTVAGQGAVILSVVNYSEADLSAETASTYTFGVDFEPGDTGLRLGATYYNIDYKDRIDVAPQGGLDPFATPNLLPDVIYRPPSAAYIEKALTETRLLANATSVSLADPTAAAAALFARPDVWVYDNRFRNLALSKQEGIDFNASQSFATAWGDISLGASITHILKYDQQGSATSTVFSASDIPGGPADWRGRINAGFSNGPLNANLGVNFVDDYRNPSAPVGQQTIDSWSTVDLALSYDFGASGEASPLNGTRFSLSVQNLFNSDPPKLGSGVGSNIIFPVGFDPANANPLGSLIVLGITKTW
ncbi:MAG: TonB-dependent receptor, partial [Burkholderiales bacterium]